eukprot:TRINITY_DN17580_c0_g1_i5.p1 TRINITY_DN17580_c0_g1~~TRINITY_DN17580_c0_g1_i5.p1  ORF type:complete len:218 (+),score=4.56 TRINITY_DN17580_c0_g1_i5:522-1175(+)
MTHLPFYDMENGEYKLVAGIEIRTGQYQQLDQIPNLEDERIRILMEAFDQFVHGTLLGDLCINPKGSIQIKQRDCQFVLQKYMFLFQMCKPNISYSEEYRYDKKKEQGNWYNSWRQNTKNLFKHYRASYYTYNAEQYNNLQKELPENIDKMLISGLAIAQLIMDDGSKQQNTIGIYSQGFKQTCSYAYKQKNNCFKNMCLDSFDQNCAVLVACILKV